MLHRGAVEIPVFNKENSKVQALFVFFSYKTVVRPSYKVVYRTVTSLEWKCCPGYSGTACEEGESSRFRFWSVCRFQTGAISIRPYIRAALPEIKSSSLLRVSQTPYLQF